VSKEESEKTPEADATVTVDSQIDTDMGVELADEAQVTENPIDEQAQEIVRLKAELDDVKDQFIRKVAEMDNFRKRLLRDKEEAMLFANRALLTDLIGVIDDFERAIKSSEQSRDFDTLHNGVAMIEQQFVSLLERKYALKRLDSVGVEFNPELHEAIMMEDRDDQDTALVLEDYQKGYTLNEKILRTAKVKVSRPTKV
jgi:molecular chaperone GrpE